MSVIFGRWNFDGKPPAIQDLDAVRSIAAPHAPDGSSAYSGVGIEILYHAFHTTQESSGEIQPFVTQSGVVITWDGRLDSRDELRRECDTTIANDCPDVFIVAAAYEKWRTACFARLLGDWALSVWDPHNRSLILARDTVGIRPLFYSNDADCVAWSTILEPLVQLGNKSFALNEEYVAGWLSFFPAAHLTPYDGIRSVPPSTFVRIQRGMCDLTLYWDFDPAKKISHHTDREYEEHFRNVFAGAVARRLRANAPVLAELSGGMDSSAIVCVADTMVNGDRSLTPRLDTISYYNDSEPNWDERSYFSKVEEKRGRAGFHINVGADEFFALRCERDRFAAMPGDPGRHCSQSAADLGTYISSNGNRVLLSGVGGDEVTGGVPSPEPELADLLMRADFGSLAHALKGWALAKRRPWFQLLFESVCPFFPPDLSQRKRHLGPAPWLAERLLETNRAAVAGYRSRVKLFGPLPSFQQNLHALEGLRRQLGCNGLPSSPPYEKRYPFLDRDLLEFFYAIPRAQVLRPGDRRSLMRRALQGIIPGEVLSRKRKAYVVRSPLAAIASQWKFLASTKKEMLSSSFGLISQPKFLEAIEHADKRQDAPLVFLLRTLALELWLRDIQSRGLVRMPSQSSTAFSADPCRTPSTLRYRKSSAS